MSAPYRNLKTEEITAFMFQRENIDEDELEELKHDIEAKGEISQPLIVRPTPEGEGFQLIDGYRRLLAVTDLGIKEVPAVVRNYDTKQAYEVIGSSEFNANFSDNDKFRLLKQMKESEGYTQEEIADIMGKTQSWVSRYLSFEKDTETIKESVKSGNITEKQARYIRKLPEPQQKEAVKEAKDLTVKQTTELVDTQETAKALKGYIDDIKEQREKLQRIKDAEQRKEEIKERKAELKAKDKKLNEKLESELQEKIDLKEKIENKYFDQKQDLEVCKTRIENVKEEIEGRNIDELEEEQENAVEKREKAKDEIEELQKKLAEAREKRDKWDNVAREKRKAIREIERAEKNLDKLEEQESKLEKKLERFEKKHKETIESFDKLKEEIREKNEEIATQKEEIAKELGELTEEIRSKVGIANNRGTVEKKLRELKAEAEATVSESEEDLNGGVKEELKNELENAFELVSDVENVEIEF